MKHIKSLKSSGIALFAILLSSCNPNGLEPVFFSSADGDDIAKNSFELVLDASAEKTAMKLTSKTENGETNVRTEWLKDGSIAAKTKVRLLARSYIEYTKGSKRGMFYLGPDYIVELPDGSRCIALLDKQGDGFWTDSLTAMKKKLPLYHREGRTKTVKYKNIENFIGKPFAEVEKKLCPANQITVKDKGKTGEAVFSNVQAQIDSITFIKALVLKVENDTVIADVSPREISKPSAPKSFLGKTLGRLITFPAYITGGNVLWMDYSAWRTYSWMGTKWGVPGQLTRMIVANIIFIILFFVFYCWFAWRWAFKAVTYIKPLGNGAVTFFACLLYVIFGLLGMFIWTPFSLVWLFLIIPMLCYTSITTEVQMERCPHCHTTGKVRYLGEKLIGTTTREYDEKYKVKTGSSSHTEGNTKVNTTYYKNVTDTIRKTDKQWKQHLYCEACKQNITYYRTETDEKVVGRR